MIKKMTLTNEQAQNLYIFLQNLKTDVINNRIRWKFLKVVEENIFSYEEQIQVINDKKSAARTANSLLQSSQETTMSAKEIANQDLNSLIKESNKEIDELSKIAVTYDFNDREVFIKTQHLFGAIDPNILVGRSGKLYAEIEDAFLYVKDEETPKN